MFNENIGLPIFYAIEAILVVKLLFALVNRPILPKFEAKLTTATFLLICGLWIFSYIAASAFEGMQIFDQQSFEDNFDSNGNFLAWSMSNVNQLIMLTLNLLTCLYFYLQRRFYDAKFIWNSLRIAVVIFLLFFLLEQINKELYVSILEMLFNRRVSGAFFEERGSGTFYEPSFAGVFIGSLILPFLTFKGLSNRAIGVCLIFALFLNYSSSGFFTAFCGFLIFFWYRASKMGLSKKIILILLAVISASLIYYALADILADYYAEKAETDSSLIRGYSNIIGLQGIWQSYGLGIGVGSSRVSSLIICLILNFGVFGFYFLFRHLRMMFRTFEELSTHRVALAQMMWTCFIGSFAANPDYYYQPFWIFFIAAVCVSVGSVRIYKEDLSRKSSVSSLSNGVVSAEPVNGC